MQSNDDLNERRAASVARAIAYTSTFTAARAENAELWDVEGNRYIDFCGGMGCQNTGHRHPKVIAAIVRQLENLATALNNGLVLVGAGPERNVIRILVPLTADFDLVDRGLDILESAIEDVAGGEASLDK